MEAACCTQLIKLLIKVSSQKLNWKGQSKLWKKLNCGKLHAAVGYLQRQEREVIAEKVPFYLPVHYLWPFVKLNNDPSTFFFFFLFPNVLLAPISTCLNTVAANGSNMFVSHEGKNLNWKVPGVVSWVWSAFTAVCESSSWSSSPKFPLAAHCAEIITSHCDSLNKAQRFMSKYAAWHWCTLNKG